MGIRKRIQPPDEIRNFDGFGPIHYPIHWFDEIFLCLHLVRTGKRGSFVRVDRAQTVTHDERSGVVLVLGVFGQAIRQVVFGVEGFVAGHRIRLYLDCGKRPDAGCSVAERGVQSSRRRTLQRSCS